MKTRNVQARRSAARLRGRPTGFTLVEILMVILIIGMLVSLLGVAASFAIRAAKRAAINVEISNLDAAMQKLSTNSLGGEYPPCMAIPPGVSPDRATQFNRVLRKRFPRSTVDYANLQANILQGGAAVIPSWTGWFSRAGDLQSGTPVKLNLNTMDAAEALVFWLAGPPTPFDPATNQPLASTVLYGFGGNATTPFAPKGSRESSLYEFDETRLTDADGDGWPEYTPPGITSKPNVAPYVYFDSPSYTYTASGTTYVPCYPGTAFPITGGTPSNLVPSEWGFAVPYADTAAPTAWNPKKFQIVCAGLDSEYGAGPTDSGGSRPSLPLVPKPGSSALQALLEGDWDNQTNFVSGVLEDQTGQ